MITIKREANPVTFTPRYVVIDNDVSWFKVEQSTIDLLNDTFYRYKEDLVTLFVQSNLHDYPGREADLTEAIQLILTYDRQISRL